MNSYEKKCLDFTNKYKDWQVICAAKDSYLAGYSQAIKDVEKYLLSKESTILVADVGKEQVEVEFPNGSHQLTRDSMFHKDNK